MVSVPQIIAFSFSNIRQIIEVFGFIYLFYYFAEEHSIYHYNNSDSWLIMLMQPDLEGHELLH